MVSGQLRAAATSSLPSRRLGTRLRDRRRLRAFLADHGVQHQRRSPDGGPFAIAKVAVFPLFGVVFHLRGRSGPYGIHIIKAGGERPRAGIRGLPCRRRAAVLLEDFRQGTVTPAIGSRLTCSPFSATSGTTNFTQQFAPRSHTGEQTMPGGRSLFRTGSSVGGCDKLGRFVLAATIFG